MEDGEGMEGEDDDLDQEEDDDEGEGCIITGDSKPYRWRR